MTRPSSPQADPVGSSGATRRLLADRVARYLMAGAAGFTVLVLVAVYAFVGSQSFSIFAHVNPIHFLFVDHWTPYLPPAQHPDYGAAGIIAGSLIIVGLAIVLATPLALGAALFIEQTDHRALETASCARCWRSLWASPRWSTDGWG